MLRWIATAAIALLFALNLALPGTSLGRRGSDDQPRADIAGVLGQIGTFLPHFALESPTGQRLDSRELLGHRVLLIFERSVDW